MRLTRYGEYKSSGLAWLGEVPRHWSIMPIRYAARLESGHTPSRSRPDWWENCTVPWFTLADIGQIRRDGVDVIYETKEKVSELGLANSSARRLPAGTVMLSRTASVGFSAIMGVEMATTQDFANWVCGSSLLPRFLLHVFRAMGSEFSRLMIGSTHNTIYMPDIASLRFALPTLEEQGAITTFLDRETAKIDALIAEQEKLLTLLAEKRQATISHAVTKGLNPDAPMKDSGVTWLGKVPKHWDVRRLKHLIRPGVSISYGIVQPGEPQDDGVPFLQTSNMSDASFGLEQLQRTTKEIAAAYPRSKLFGGEVILGIRASIGAAYVVPSDLIGANLSRGIARIECGDFVTPRYLMQTLRSAATAHYWGLTKQGSTFNEVSIEAVRELSVAVPPLKEQEQISSFLEAEILKIDELAG